MGHFISTAAFVNPLVPALAGLMLTFRSWSPLSSFPFSPSGNTPSSAWPCGLRPARFPGTSLVLKLSERFNPCMTRMLREGPEPGCPTASLGRSLGLGKFCSCHILRTGSTQSTGSAVEVGGPGARPWALAFAGCLGFVGSTSQQELAFLPSALAATP